MSPDLEGKGVCSQITIVVYFSVSGWFPVTHSVYLDVGAYHQIKW